MDYGQKATDKLLRKVEARINGEFATAMTEIETELNNYLHRFEVKDEKWRSWVKSGEKTREEYNRWRIGQMAVGKRWNDEKTLIATQLFKTNEAAKGIIRKYMPEMYAENYNFATYQVEKDAHIDTMFTLYSRESVIRLAKDNPEVLPPVGKKTAKAIAEGKAIRWNKQQLQSAMTQGILQGDSIPKLASRIARTVGDRDRKAAIRNARTAATGAQNAGRVGAYKRAQEKGVDLEQMWMATLDGRTRHSHRWLDGEVRPVGEEFSNGCEYPADPKGDPEEIYNCRCSLRGVVKGLDRKSGEFRSNEKIGDMTYDEWRNAKPVSGKITKQDEAAKKAKEGYINEYSGNKATKNAEPIRYGEYRGISFDDDNLRAHMGDGSMLDPVKMVMEDTGFDNARAEQAINDITSWVGSACGKIRSREGNYADVADRIEEFIAASPKYEGTIYRGISLEAEKINPILDNLYSGKAITQEGISSWSTGREWAEEFASMTSRDKTAPIRVVFQIDDNKSGVSIKHIADIDNDEVIQSAKARYFLNGDIQRIKEDGMDYYLIRLKEK